MRSLLWSLVRPFRGLALVLVGLCVLSAAASAAPARWSLDRASFGLDAKAAVTEPEGGSSFLGGAYLSYSLTSQMSVAGTVERDFAGHLTIARAGVRFPIFHLDGGNGRVTAGANLVAYSDDGAAGIVEPTSWDAVVSGSGRRAENEGTTVLWGIASASYDPENDRSTYRLGLRWQALGGVPR